MKLNIKRLLGYGIKETDGDIGKVDEFYFDDNTWTVRYIIVKTGNWLSGRKVLISPGVLLPADWENKVFPVKLTQAQIEGSPDIDTNKPVSRQNEKQLTDYYSWDEYWGEDPEEHGAGIFGMMPSELYESGVSNLQPVADDETQNYDRHLRSTKEVTGYGIHASNGEIGKVVDYIIDDHTWKLEYFVVDTGNWLNSRKVLIPVQWIKDVSWDNSVVVVDVTTEAVESSPEFDPDTEIKYAYIDTFNKYYNKKK